MNRKRIYREFIYKEAIFHICCDRFEAVTDEILRQRHILEHYIQQQPEFKNSFKPLDILSDAPESVMRMARAARAVGVGPMAAVAGVMAQLAAEAGLLAGAEEVIVENGGDIYVKTTAPVVVGLYSGGTGILPVGHGQDGHATKILNRLAFELPPADTPISICSSSGKMGHSTSLGDCDLATVVAKDAALADAAATQAANLVRHIDDVEPALNRIAAIDGIDGVLIVKDGHVGLAGKLPALTKTAPALRH